MVNKLISNLTIERECIVLAYRMQLTNPKFNFNDPDFKVITNYDINMDKTFLFVQYKDKSIKSELTYSDLKMNVDDLTDLKLRLIILELRDSFNMYDDAGQIK